MRSREPTARRGAEWDPDPVSDGLSQQVSAASWQHWLRARRARFARSGSVPGTPAPSESLRGLDWLNFFLAAMLMGFGPFLGLHLAGQGWLPASVGLVLTTGGLAALLSQIPAGELIDRVKSKRALVGAGAAALAGGLLILGLRPDFPSVLAAVVVQGVAASIIGPGIASISLGLVGHEALAGRLGRNQRYASIGGLAAAGIIGMIGYLVSTSDIFLVASALGIPLFVMLARIRARDIHFARSCGAPNLDNGLPQKVGRLSLLRDWRLLTFAACLFLFQLANASMLPLAGQSLVRAEGARSSLVLSGLIVVPQIIVAVLASWVGQTAETLGRRPLLLIGIGVLPLRAACFALTADPVPLLIVQALDGLSGATLGILTALVIADLTNGTGRFNLAQGLVGTISGIGAALSTSISGIVVTSYGPIAGFSGVAAVGLLAFAILGLFMPETKPIPAGLDPASRTM